MSRRTLAGRARTRQRKALAAVTAAAAVLVLIAVIIAAMTGGSGTGSAPRPAPAVDPVAASSAPAPLPVVYSQVEGWHGGQVRPAAIYVGQGGSPYVRALKWPTWTAAGAQANGYLHMQRPGCALPTYQCPYQRFRVEVQLSRVETHDGVRYYSRMRWTFVRNHVSQVLGWRTYRGYWRN
jgi:hypothetical protein